jgi:hypothetical protein
MKQMQSKLNISFTKILILSVLGMNLVGTTVYGEQVSISNQCWKTRNFDIERESSGILRYATNEKVASIEFSCGLGSIQQVRSVIVGLESEEVTPVDMELRVHTDNGHRHYFVQNNLVQSVLSTLTISVNLQKLHQDHLISFAPHFILIFSSLRAGLVVRSITVDSEQSTAASSSQAGVSSVDQTLTERSRASEEDGLAINLETVENLKFPSYQDVSNIRILEDILNESNALKQQISRASSDFQRLKQFQEEKISMLTQSKSRIKNLKEKIDNSETLAATLETDLKALITAETTSIASKREAIKTLQTGIETVNQEMPVKLAQLQTLAKNYMSLSDRISFHQSVASASTPSLNPETLESKRILVKQNQPSGLWGALCSSSAALQTVASEAKQERDRLVSLEKEIRQDGLPPKK